MNLNSAYLNEAQVYEKKWEKLGTLGGIKDKATRLTVATLMENQQRMNSRMLGESVIGTDATGTDDVATFRRVSIPMVYRVFAPLVANKIVSVQPLLGPVGLVHYIRFRYATARGNQTGTDVQWPASGWDTNSMQQSQSGVPVANVYYSHQRVDHEPITNAGGGTSLTYQLAHTPLLSNSVYASSADASELSDAVVAGTGYTIFGQIFDGATARFNFSAQGSGTAVALTLTEIGSGSPDVSAGTINTTTGVISLTWGSDPSANSIICSYAQNMECTTDIPKVTMTIEQDEIRAFPRKLKADWSWEADQDLYAQHNISAEETMTSVLSQEISLEIDREIITDLINGAGTVVNWNLATALGDTLKERYESLYVKVVETSNIIMKKTLRGQANWVVASPEVCSIFETAVAGFSPAQSTEFESTLGIQYVGMVAGRWKLYKDPLFPVTKVLLGFKGDNVLDSGYYFCPYIPLQMTPTILDPDTLCPRKGVITRYGAKMLRDGGKYYAVINIQNFNIS